MKEELTKTLHCPVYLYYLYTVPYCISVLVLFTVPYLSYQLRPMHIVATKNRLNMELVLQVYLGSTYTDVLIG
jgi:hypothetical protein